METINTMFALISGMAISVALALALQKAMLRTVMRVMVASPMMARRAKNNRIIGR